MVWGSCQEHLQEQSQVIELLELYDCNCIVSINDVIPFSRLFAEKMNKSERKNKAEILTELAGSEDSEFWVAIGQEDGEVPPDPIVEHVDPNFSPSQPRLYQVQLGMGYLELPQVEVPHSKLEHTLLQSRNVYILDCFLDVFVW